MARPSMRATAWADPYAERPQSRYHRPTSLALTPSSGGSSGLGSPEELMSSGVTGVGSRPGSGTTAPSSSKMGRSFKGSGAPGRPSSSSAYRSRFPSNLNVGATPIIIAGLPGQYTGMSSSCSLPMLVERPPDEATQAEIARLQGESEAQITRLKSENDALREQLQRSRDDLEASKEREIALQATYETELEHWKLDKEVLRKAHEAEAAKIRDECGRKLSGLEEQHSFTLEGKMVRHTQGSHTHVYVHHIHMYMCICVCVCAYT